MPRSRSLFIIAATTPIFLFLFGCNTKPERAPVIGYAFAGPATLNLHKEIDSKSPTVTSVHHGDKLAIVGQRRRWYRVRTGTGTEGWTSDRELLDTAQMQRLRGLAAETTGLPSQGIATTFSSLNVHTEPSRQSPSFVQVREKEKVDVIAHKVTERTGALEKRELIPPKPKLEKKKVRKRPRKFPSHRHRPHRSRRRTGLNCHSRINRNRMPRKPLTVPLMTGLSYGLKPDRAGGY